MTERDVVVESGLAAEEHCRRGRRWLEARGKAVLSRFSWMKPAIRFLVDVEPIVVRSTQPGSVTAAALDLDRL